MCAAQAELADLLAVHLADYLETLPANLARPVEHGLSLVSHTIAPSNCCARPARSRRPNGAAAAFPLPDRYSRSPGDGVEPPWPAGSVGGGGYWRWGVGVWFGRSVALHYRSSTLHQIP